LGGRSKKEVLAVGERRTSVIERILRRVEDRVEEWRERDKALKGETEANRDAMWAEAPRGRGFSPKP
jgi:hypothetical protein